MTIEYPEYYNRFSCVGGACKDTCCAGWEVDVDEDSYEYYSVVPGAFGERLRASMAEDGEGHWFPMTAAGRCPFLNDANLCDIYSALGEESLCGVCTEYPRYYMEIGDYEQIDMSLSCMELGRILFEETDEITYLCEQNSAAPEEILSPEDAARLSAVLADRNAMLTVLQHGVGSYRDRLIGIEIPACPEDQESDEALLAVLDDCEAINEGWHETLASLHEYVERHGVDTIGTPGTDAAADGLPAAGTASAARSDFAAGAPTELTFDRQDEYFIKLACYLVYRYSIDSYLDGDDHVNARSRRLIGRSLRMLELLCAVRLTVNGGTFTTADIIDIAHRYSKEIEHSDDNVERLKVQ